MTRVRADDYDDKLMKKYGGQRMVDLLDVPEGALVKPLDPLDAGFWENWCRPLLNVSCGVVVPDIDGWAQSGGVYREVMWTLRETQRPIFFYAEAEHG